MLPWIDFYISNAQKTGSEYLELFTFTSKLIDEMSVTIPNWKFLVKMQKNFCTWLVIVALKGSNLASCCYKSANKTDLKASESLIYTQG